MQSACKLPRDTCPFIQTPVWLSSKPHHCSPNLTASETIISNANDNNSKDVTIAVFLDLSKAFDTISHKKLKNKLEHYGIRGILCKNLFANYLCNRTQYTDIDGFKSSRMHISAGVPQGLILGPVLFLVYINDIYKLVREKWHLTMFCFTYIKFFGRFYMIST